MVLRTILVGVATIVWASLGAAADDYVYDPRGDTFAERRQELFALQGAEPGHGAYASAARIVAGEEPDEGGIHDDLDKMDARKDCADFRLNGILRLLYEVGDGGALSPELLARAKRSILDFKYWPDEPGIDSMCTWSENHYIMYTAGGYLAGQLFPDDVFTNSGQTGREKMAICRPRVLRWMDLRYRAGFSEWLSNCYYDEDLTPLLNLVDFCEDDEIVRRASMIVDLLFADMALNSFHGAFGSTHGRAYANHKQWPRHESTASAQRLAFGMNVFHPGNMTVNCLALSRRYQIPRVLCEIATDFTTPAMVNRQRMGIRLEQLRHWGLSPRRLEDGVLLYGMECQGHPRIINLTMRMLDEYNWWENRFFEGFKKQRKLIETARRFRLMRPVTLVFRHDTTRNVLEEANIYTYRTPDYMLSTAQDYRKGFGGAQQHIWQATLGPETTCFTTHPVDEEGGSPGYWTGTGSLPRAAQVENVAVVLYKVRTRRGLYITHKELFTHAWFPQDRFDQVVENGPWVFGRKGDAYLALWSQQPTPWQTEREGDKDRELIAPGTENVWICEMGRRAVDGPFETFVARLAGAAITTDGLRVTYESPSQGRLEFSWRTPLRRNGRVVPLRDYPRYDNPYGHAPFPGSEIRFEHNGEWLRLDWENVKREVSSFGSVPLAR